MKQLNLMTEAELSVVMTAAADSVMGSFAAGEVETPLFCLIVFNNITNTQYISNCRRDEVIGALREVADRLERKQELARQEFLGET